MTIIDFIENTPNEDDFWNGNKETRSSKGIMRKANCKTDYNSTPSEDYISFICKLYDDIYDDRKEDSRPHGENWNPGVCANHRSLESFRRDLKNSYDIALSTAKIRKILITGGCWTTESSRNIQRYYNELKSISEVANKLGVSTAIVTMNLPYEKVVYDLENKSGNARRIEKYREKHLIDKC